MMRAHLDDAHERGEPIAALWASEETIYGRFGYGPAAYAGEVKIPREYVDFVAPRERAGTDPDRRARRGAREVPAALGGARARAARACSSARPSGGSCARSPIRPSAARGAGPKRFALLERDGEPGGVRRSTATRWTGTKACRAARCRRRGDRRRRRQRSRRSGATCSTSTGSRRSRRRSLPPDHPLFFVLAQTRRMRYRLGDGLWVRLLDVGAALSGRTYPRGRRARVRRARRVLSVERGPVAPRRRRGRAHRRRRRSRARRRRRSAPRSSAASASRSSRRAAASRS